jgi:hypothetical protein
MMDRNELAKRLEEYLRRRAAMRSIHPEEIHSIGGFGDNDFAVLTVSDLRAAAEIIRQSAWRPMSEAPRDGTRIVLFREMDGYSATCRYVASERPYPWLSLNASRGGALVFSDDTFDGWMPLPPPTSEGVEG